MTLAIAILSWCAAGLMLGAAYLFLLGRTVAAISGDQGWLGAVGPLMLRLMLAGAVLALAARNGALPPLSVLAGFLVARGVVLRRMRAD